MPVRRDGPPVDPTRRRTPSSAPCSPTTPEERAAAHGPDAAFTFLEHLVARSVLIGLGIATWTCLAARAERLGSDRH